MSEQGWDLSRLTTGERSALRRAAGTLRYNVAARRAYYKLEPYLNRYGEDQRYAALCFACVWRETDTVGGTLPMESCLRTLCRNEEGIVEGMAKRVDALLEIRWAEDDYLLGKLNNLMQLLHGRGEVMPDFKALADDLIHWNDENMPVQRRWLRAIYQDKRKPDENQETEEKPS